MIICVSFRFAEAKRITKNASPNHNSIHARMFSGNFQPMFSVADVAVDSQERLWGNFIAQFNNLINQFIMRRNFAHLFFCAQMNCQVHNVLLENCRQPLAPLVDVSIAQPSFYANGQSRFFGGINCGYCYIGSTDQSRTAAFNRRLGGTTESFHIPWLATPDLCN